MRVLVACDVCEARETRATSDAFGRGPDPVFVSPFGARAADLGLRTVLWTVACCPIWRALRAAAHAGWLDERALTTEAFAILPTRRVRRVLGLEVCVVDELGVPRDFQLQKLGCGTYRQADDAGRAAVNARLERERHLALCRVHLRVQRQRNVELAGFLALVEREMKAVWPRFRQRRTQLDEYGARARRRSRAIPDHVGRHQHRTRDRTQHRRRDLGHPPSLVQMLPQQRSRAVLTPKYSPPASCPLAPFRSFRMA